MGLINMSLNSGINDSLIKGIANQDIRSFNELYERTKTIVFSIALSITKSPSESEDITQEVYIKILENSMYYQSQEKPLAWIYAIARNQSISRLRNNKNIEKINELENDIRLSIINDPTDILIIKSALKTLNEEELEIVMLHNSGLKHREIAKMLDKPLSTILSKYKRSINKMRIYLQEN